MLVEPQYPGGHIAFYPAVNGGLTGTFPHQHFNGHTSSSGHWRSGDVCLDDYFAVLGRGGGSSEPSDAHNRLQWRVLRAIDWIGDAARGELLREGDQFELPDFPESKVAPRVAFSEDKHSFDCWQSSDRRWGRCEITRTESIPNTAIIRRFFGQGNRVFIDPTWGAAVSGRREIERGIWLRLPALPVRPPWQAPETWGELGELASNQGVNLNELLRAAARSVRDGRSHIFLVGFPIPEKMGGPLIQMHWQGLEMPPLCLPYQVPHGFRPTEEGQWFADLRGPLASNRTIDWLPTQNWNAKEIATRGRFSEQVSSKVVAIIGAGALGSAIAELLVRGGVREIRIFDGQTLEIGNLVRHSLLLQDIGKGKARALADRLNAISPHVNAAPHAEPFVPGDHGFSELQKADVIIETTGSDDVIKSMGSNSWGEAKLLVSISIGLGARRMYMYVAFDGTFPSDAFHAAVDPLVEEDLDNYDGEVPWEGMGCWHPVFPARSDDIWLLAAAGMKRLASLIDSPPESGALTVIEQTEEGGLVSVRSSVA